MLPIDTINRSIICSAFSLGLLLGITPIAHAERYTPPALCTATSDSSYEALAIPLPIENGDEFASGAIQNLNVDVNTTAPLPTSANLSIGAGADGTTKASGTSFGDVKDGDLNTYWSPIGGTGRVSVKWAPATETINRVIIKEAAGFVGNIGDWRLVNHDNGDLLASGTGAGQINFNAVTLTKVNFFVDSSSGTPAVAEYETYYEPNAARVDNPSGDLENVFLFLDTDQDGTGELLGSGFCHNDVTQSPTGCTAYFIAALPSVTEDTSFRGRFMLSYDDNYPTDSCGDNGYGDSSDFTIVIDVPELITITDVSAAEDDGPITVTATLSHNVRDGSGLVPFDVDYTVSDGTATIADNDYVATSGTLSFSGAQGDTATFTIQPVSDTTTEGDEYVTVSFTSITNSTHGIDISDTAQVAFLEDDSVELSMTKSVDDTNPNIGQTIVFTLRIDNAGPGEATDVSVEDNFPLGFGSVAAVSSPVGTSISVLGNNVNWTGLTIPAGSFVEATLSAVVQSP